jgi:hypothetical protein
LEGNSHLRPPTNVTAPSPTPHSSVLRHHSSLVARYSTPKIASITLEDGHFAWLALQHPRPNVGPLRGNPPPPPAAGPARSCCCAEQQIWTALHICPTNFTTSRHDCSSVCARSTGIHGTSLSCRFILLMTAGMYLAADSSPHSHQGRQVPRPRMGYLAQAQQLGYRPAAHRLLTILLHSTIPPITQGRY